MEISAKKSRHGERDYLRVARTLRDKLDGLITSRTTDLGTQREILLDVSQESALVLANNATHRYDEISTCTHSCCEHEQVMNPGLWSTLPMELLQRVLAKLPFPDICRLQSLSKEWQLSLQSSSSEFTLALKESSPMMFARVSSAGRFGFRLHVLDRRNNRWQELLVNVASRNAQCRGTENVPVEFLVHMNGAADAGLVCYVYKECHADSEVITYRIYVINPMTGVVKPLPHIKLTGVSDDLIMMRIVVDRNTFHYKVIVVKRTLPVEAEVYDSEVQQWTKPDPSLGRIFGIAHSWFTVRFPDAEYSVWRAHKVGLCAYDCHDGKYYKYPPKDQEKWLGLGIEDVMSYTLMKDRLFVLHWGQREDGEDAVFVSEYCVSQDATSWVKEKTLPGLSWQPDEAEMINRIHACSGFLFVFQHGGRLVVDEPPPAVVRLPPTRNTKLENGWVYDFATCEWRTLPRFPWWSTNESQSLLTDVMSELHWNRRP